MVYTSRALRFKQGFGKLEFYFRVQCREERIWTYVCLLAWVGDLLLTYSLFVDKTWGCWEAGNSTQCNLDYGFEWPIDSQPAGITTAVVFATCGQALITIACAIQGLSMLSMLCVQPASFYVFRAVCLTTGVYLLGFSLMIHVIVAERIKMDFYKLVTNYSSGLLLFLFGWSLVIVADTVDMVGCVLPYALQNPTDRYIWLWLHRHYIFYKYRLLYERYRIVPKKTNINDLERAKSRYN
ncbi:unnamed protein product [Dibothriocephalus latus]|uniref:Uncharacterized protein n=1 Tax=Dibothriocephalus latus TaxID=60516 RepID=A0A3P7LLH4_DIBLA|nr:unnamed protein product [Dibothriocephalus latus]